MKLPVLSLVILSFLSISCKKEPTTGTTPSTTPPNVLFIIADDFGLDACPNYPLGTIKPSMPNLERLMSEGVTFDNFWSSPVCTPTRATLLTGKYGHQTNVLQVDDVLSQSEYTVQQHITQGTFSKYSQAIIGKWHLSKDASHPITAGADYFAGILSGGVPSYTNWSLVENGQTSTSTEYSTSKFTDLSIEWVKNQDTPWFLWLAYNAPHTPFHLPADSLHSQGALPSDQASIDANPLPYYIAMCEAMDHEMGRLINSLSPEDKANTVIIFIGDNGTPGQVVQEYISQRAKGSVYNGGINVPLVVSGAGVTRVQAREDALVSSVDMFATISEIVRASSLQGGVPSTSTSFWNTVNGVQGARFFSYSEIGEIGASDYTIRNSTHKYILFENLNESLFDLSANPIESPNLLRPNQLPLSSADSIMLEELKMEADRIRD